MMEPSRATVREAIRNGFPHDWERIFRDMKWDSGDGFWWIMYRGIFVGIEPDGYIHS